MIFQKNDIVVIPHLDCSLPYFTLFLRNSVQKETLLKTLIVKLYTTFKSQVLENWYTLFSDTYPAKPNKEVANPYPSQDLINNAHIFCKL